MTTVFLPTSINSLVVTKPFPSGSISTETTKAGLRFVKQIGTLVGLEVLLDNRPVDMFVKSGDFVVHQGDIVFVRADRFGSDWAKSQYAMSKVAPQLCAKDEDGAVTEQSFIFVPVSEILLVQRKAV